MGNSLNKTSKAPQSSSNATVPPSSGCKKDCKCPHTPKNSTPESPKKEELVVEEVPAVVASVPENEIVKNESVVEVQEEASVKDEIPVVENEEVPEVKTTEFVEPPVVNAIEEPKTAEEEEAVNVEQSEEAEKVEQFEEVVNEEQPEEVVNVEEIETNNENLPTSTLIAEDSVKEEETEETREEETELVDESIIEFSIANQKLKLDNAEDVKEYVDFIQKHVNIKHVFLTGNTLGVEASKALANAIDSLLNIEEFDLHDCFTSRMKEEVHVSVEAFAHVLKTKESLTKVDFSDNAFGPIGAKAVSILLSESTSLREIILNNNGLGPEGGKIIAQSLISSQEKNNQQGKPSSLRRLEIGRNRLENGSANLMSQALQAHGNLEDVAFPQNGIRPEGISELSEGIGANINLTKINLQDNTFTQVGSTAFASSIHNLTKLETLNIGDCLVGNEGCVLVIDALLQSKCPITHLNLQYNEMTEDGVNHLISKINEFNLLKVLMLNGNTFNPVGNVALELKEKLQSIDKADIIDSWSDMEYYSDEEESEEEQEEEESELEESDKEHDLAQQLEKIEIADESDN